MVIVTLIVLGVLAWNLIAWRVIGDRPRAWSYGAARAIPAESYASSEPPPPPSQAPKQVELPPPLTKWQEPFGSAQGKQAPAQQGEPR